MTIIYAVICRAKDAAILSEVCERDIKGTFGAVWVELMQHLRDHPEFFENGDLKTFIQRNQAELDFFSHFLEACSAALSDEGNDANLENYFHLYFKDGVFYGCLGDDSDVRDQKVNFAFLIHIEKEFVKMHRAGRIKTANAYALDKNFAPTMRAAMHYHNMHHKELRQDAKVAALMAQVQDIRKVMGRNLHMILERGEKFEGLLNKSDNLTKDAQVFKKRAHTAKSLMQRKYFFWYAMIVGILMLFSLFIVVSSCGLRLEYCRASARHGEDTNNGDDSGESTSNVESDSAVEDGGN